MSRRYTAEELAAFARKPKPWFVYSGPGARTIAQAQDAAKRHELRMGHPATGATCSGGEATEPGSPETVAVTLENWDGDTVPDSFIDYIETRGSTEDVYDLANENPGVIRDRFEQYLKDNGEWK